MNINDINVPQILDKLAEIAYAKTAEHKLCRESLTDDMCQHTDAYNALKIVNKVIDDILEQGNK